MDSLTFAVVGAAYGTSIAIGLTWRARRLRSAADALLGAVVACGAVAAIAIVLEHRAAGFPSLLLETAEYAATLAIGPLLLLYIRALTGRPPAAGDLGHFVPLAAALALPPAGGTPLLGAPIELLMAHQMLYTVLAAHRFVGVPSPERRERLAGAATLALMGSIHVAQIVRLAWSASPRLEDVVPVVLAVLMLGAGAVAAGRVLVAGGRPPRARRPAPAATAAVLERLAGAMERDHHYRDPDLSLHALAAILETTPHDLSRAINESHGASLSALLRRWRVDDAKRRLGDPAHDLYTIEGVGQMSGFGSRSAFHQAFRAETGMTPSQYRQQRDGATG